MPQSKNEIIYIYLYYIIHLLSLGLINISCLDKRGKQILETNVDYRFFYSQNTEKLIISKFYITVKILEHHLRMQQKTLVSEKN